MYKRLIIVSAIIFASLCGLSILGWYSIGLHAEGLAARRAGEFIAVAEQIRLDVKHKLDQFIAAEQNRPYTDYQYFYVPFAANDASALVRSPLADSLTHGLAYGYFQIDADGAILSPYNRAYETPEDPEVSRYLDNLNRNVLSTLAGSGPAIRPETVGQIAIDQQMARYEYNQSKMNAAISSGDLQAKSMQSKGKGAQDLRRSEYRIPSLEEPQQTAQIITGSRANVVQNFDNSSYVDYYSDAGPQTGEQVQEQISGQMDGQLTSFGAPLTRARTQTLPQPAPRQVQSQVQAPALVAPSAVANTAPPAAQLKPYDSYPLATAPTASRQQARTDGQQAFAQDETSRPERPQAPKPLSTGPDGQLAGGPQSPPPEPPLQQQMPTRAAADTIQIRIEPFRPIVVPDGSKDTMIPGQVFLLRHVQIEQRHFIQGFKLNEDELVRQVAESAGRHVVRRDMDFDVGRTESPRAVHTAILDFGFGDLILNLFELKPLLIANQISMLRKGFFAVVAVVFVAVALAQVSLWRTATTQIRLAKKKDDFISAVSHELRTPLTTIRMHTEMLEKGWVKNEEKRNEYYGAMLQETERLSRLIENVLDFSRIQRGRKKYQFKLGDVNTCIGDVVDMMTPCAAQAGFTLERDFADMPPFAFDADAVMQIVINLLDNAIKYARQAAEKTIRIRTRCESGYAFIEVEDHGPGIPRLQRKRIFEEFYRLGDEAKRETTGTGLGLALVKRFAQAHDGFVEVLAARPTGAIFRVALVANTPAA